MFGRTRVDVLEQNVGEISIPVRKGGSVAFVLRYAGPHKKESGCPQRARLTLLPLEDWGALVHRNVEVGFTKATTIDHVPPGRYLLSLAQLEETCYHGGNAVIDLTGETDPDPVVVLLVPAGSIHGRLTGPANPTQVAVVLVATDPVDGAAPVQMALPDSESRFAFENLRPGRYRIAAEPAVQVTEPGSAAHLGRMFEIEVSGGAPTEVELPVPAGDNMKPEGEG
jgi:hypothetical protein